MIRFTRWPAVVLMTLTISPWVAADEWIPLFNGKNLDGWQVVDGPISEWKVEDGMIQCSAGQGWLSTADEYENFELELEFRTPPGGNSGVFLRAPHQGTAAYTGMEIQILDDTAPQYANLKPTQYCGSLYDLEPAKTRVSKPADEWQKMHIVCNGRNVKVSLNDTPIVKANLDAYPEKEATHPGLKRTRGFVGLQNHGSRLDFRNVRLRKLP